MIVICDCSILLRFAFFQIVERIRLRAHNQMAGRIQRVFRKWRREAQKRAAAERARRLAREEAADDVMILCRIVIAVFYFHVVLLFLSVDKSQAAEEDP